MKDTAARKWVVSVPATLIFNVQADSQEMAEEIANELAKRIDRDSDGPQIVPDFDSSWDFDAEEEP